MVESKKNTPALIINAIVKGKAFQLDRNTETLS
jgi:hypothetical protein